jgi:hypothetical protein
MIGFKVNHPCLCWIHVKIIKKKYKLVHVICLPVLKRMATTTYLVLFHHSQHVWKEAAAHEGYREGAHLSAVHLKLNLKNMVVCCLFLLFTSSTFCRSATTVEFVFTLLVTQKINIYRNPINGHIKNKVQDIILMLSLLVCSIERSPFRCYYKIYV